MKENRKNSRAVIVLGKMEITENRPDPNSLGAFKNYFLESVLEKKEKLFHRMGLQLS